MLDAEVGRAAQDEPAKEREMRSKKDRKILETNIDIKLRGRMERYLSIPDKPRDPITRRSAPHFSVSFNKPSRVSGCTQTTKSCLT